MTSPQTLMHAETRDKSALVTKETGLLEELTYECLSSLEDIEEKLTTCSVSTTNSYKCTILVESFKASAFL